MVGMTSLWPTPSPAAVLQREWPELSFRGNDADNYLFLRIIQLGYFLVVIPFPFTLELSGTEVFVAVYFSANEALLDALSPRRNQKWEHSFLCLTDAYNAPKCL